ncbi:MAG: membrane dipeptidase, partial [Flavobacteriales bacterium]|nr:membrane dipeptidase [Flavobacteriales bacterium]
QVAQTAGWKLICCALHPAEKQVVTYCGFQLIARGTPTEFDVQHLRALAMDTPTYYDLLLQEVAHLKASLAHPPVGMTAPIHIGDMGAYTIDDATTYAFFTVEGAHAFCADTDGSEPIDHVLQRLIGFRKEHGLAAVNLCHFQQHRFATPAYAFIYKKYKPSARLLFPTGTGITADGHRFIETCHTHGVAVDLKHMGWSARKEFYERYAGTRFIASHVGVTGLSWAKNASFGIIKWKKDGPGRVRVHYRKPAGALPDTLFAPCSLNLYDEDIRAIIASVGIIGLSMDQRILGAGEPLLSFDHVKKRDRELVSKEDFERYFRAKFNVADEVPDDE